MSTMEKPKQAVAGLESGVWSSADGALLGIWARANAELVKGAFDLAEEMLEFGRKRVEADLGAWKAAAGCRNPTELAECQKHFAEEATAQYFDQADKLARRLTSLMSGAAAPFRNVLR